MGSEWKETTLGEFAPFNYGKGLPKRKRNPEGGIPVYGSNGITGYHDEALIEKGIIIGRKGSIGEVEYSENPFWPIDTTFYVEESPQRDIRFTYYLLKSLPLQQMNSDSAVPGLNRNAAHSLKIKVPDLDEQKRIAHILGTLDDKIELNQQMNETLESIARAIFKSWFVDFDPVRAKMFGEPYPLPDEIMALFPDELVESELGLIPKGWEIKTLSEVSQITKGVSYRSKDLEGTRFALVNLKSINRGGGYRLDGLKPFCGDFKCEQEVHHGEIILAYTDVTQAAELLGRPARVQKIDNRRLIASLDIGIVRSEILPKEFIYFTLNSYRFNEYAKNHANGTTVLHLSRKAVPKFKLLIPPYNLLLKFSKFCGNYFKKADDNIYQNEILPKIRDVIINQTF